MAKLIQIIALAITGVFLASGCGNACEELARKRCECERTEIDQRSCKRHVDDEASNIDVTTAEKEVCENLLDQCTCEKLAAGDLQACGLAKESDR